MFSSTCVHVKDHSFLSEMERHDDGIVAFDYACSAAMARRASQVCPMPMTGILPQGPMARLWRGLVSDSIPNPNCKFEFGSFRGPRNRIWFGSGAQEPDSVRLPRPHDQIRFGLAFLGSNSVRIWRPVRFGFCIRTRGKLECWPWPICMHMGNLVHTRAPSPWSSTRQMPFPYIPLALVAHGICMRGH